MRTSRQLVKLFVLAFAFVPATAMAQGSITGVVKDSSGALLPGATVEATSPALIERVRSAVTDGTGQYRIIDLRPGAYTVTVTLAGFSSYKREGIELTGSFTATIDVELKVGTVAETVTVTGQSPIVDVQAVTQERVLSKDVIDAIPAGRGQSALAVLIPGMQTGGQDVGGQNTQTLSAISIHGGRATDQRQAVDGLTIRNVAGQGNSTNTVIDVGSSQEMTIDYAAGSAEAITGGVLFNFVPKEGGNSFSGSFFGTQTGGSFQNVNYTSDLAAQGLKAPNSLKHLHDYDASFGGPIAKDKLWFYSSARFQESQGFIAGLWENANAGNASQWLYSADLSRQTFSSLRSNTVNSRVTWQASSRNKFNVYYDQSFRHWDAALSGVSSESEQKYDFPRLRTTTVGWSSPLNSRLLVDVRVGFHAEDIFNFWPSDPNDPYRSLIGIVEQNQIVPGVGSIGTLRYHGRANTNDTSIAANDQIASDTGEVKGSVSYVTGSHAFKFGVSDFWGTQTYNSPDNNSAYNIRLNGGVPNQITERQNQYAGLQGGVRAELGLFAQDKWTVKQFTVNAGLRYDYNYTGWNAFHLGPGPLVPTRSIDFPDTSWYTFKDLSPRLGVAYDVFGKGKTAVKVNIGKYGLAPDPTQGNPISTRLVNRVTRSWTDKTSPTSPNYFVPNCDLLNPLANGDCGQIGDLRFGTPIPSTSYDPAILGGWNVRPNNWELATSVQHEIVTGVGVDVGYFRRWYEHFTVTQNRALLPTDFTPYSIPVPVDSRLPNSGQTLGGFFDVNTTKFGQVDNYVTSAGNFGGQTEVFNGFDFSANARLHGFVVRGGVSTGKVTQDVCNIVLNNPQVTVTTTVGTAQSTTMCHVETPFLTQAKMLATYTVPRIRADIAATYQSLPGPLIAANYIATTAVIAPSLGRNLSGGTANVTLNLVAPGTMYGERLNELDLRFGRTFRLGTKVIRGNLDIFNALNGNAVRSVNTSYAAWLVPTAILDPRLFKISAQFDF